MFSYLKTQGRIRELEEGLAKLKADYKTLELEWANVYDKMRHLMGRIAKRADVVESAQRELEPGADVTDGTEVPSTLSPRARKVQEEILRRRQRGGNGGLLHG